MFGFENWKRYVTGETDFRSPPIFRLFKSDPDLGWNASSPEELIGDVWNAYPRETRGTFHPQYWFNILRELGDGALHETRDNLYSRSPARGPLGEPLGERIRIIHPADYSQKPYIPAEPEEQLEPEEQPERNRDPWKSIPVPPGGWERWRKQRDAEQRELDRGRGAVQPEPLNPFRDRNYPERESGEQPVQPEPAGLTPEQIRTLAIPEPARDSRGVLSPCTFRVGVRGNPLCFHVTGFLDSAERYARDLYAYWRESVQVTVVDGNGDSVTVFAYFFFSRLDKPKGVS